jgi:plastocyanin
MRQRHQLPRRLPLLSLLLLSTAIVACGGNQSETPATALAPVVNPVDPATAGTISGQITFEGTPPAPQPISMKSDPGCMPSADAVTETAVVGADGSLQNVFVYVKDGLGDLQFPVPATPVVLNQQKCRYIPHVLGVQVGQPLEIVNGDATLHNVHGVAKNNREFNAGQPIQGMKMTQTFTVAEVMVPFKCDVHNWMNAWVGVLNHPFFAVTGADGAFELKGLPPGTYTVEAWHERFGVRTQQVTVGEKATATAAFTFTP